MMECPVFPLTTVFTKSMSVLESLYPGPDTRYITLFWQVEQGNLPLKMC
jgi:hypothetical protein